MSTNHYSMDLPETTLWWTQQQNPSTSQPPLHPSWPLQHHHQPTWFNSHMTHGDPTITTPHFNLNNQNDNDEEEEELENDDDDNNNNSATTTAHQGAGVEDEKEAMFEKPLTPSDVGKLNRLVIPKQHAEKYFPLGASGGGGGGDSSECKGLLLSFEDESGKCWRFRYSYWNSSQSYVLTKGWSRYVKDKRLDAGDVVLFERHRVDSQRLFINWRRRRPSGTEPAHVSRGVGYGKSSDGNSNSKNEVGIGVGVGWTRGFYSAHPYPAHHQLSPYQHDDCLHAGRGSAGQNQRTKAVGNSSSSRVLRLFGVNMECQPEHDSSAGPSYDDSNNNMPLITQGTDTQHLYHYHHQQPSSNSSNPPHPHVVRHQPYYY